MANGTTASGPGVDGAISPCSRRDVLAAVGAMLLTACTGPTGSPRPGPQRGQAAASNKVVRLLSVPTVRDGGEWSELLPEFSRQSGIDVKRQIATNDLFDLARGGEADLVYSHYGHRDVDTFVLGGYGQWPRTVLYNMIALLGPPADPAGVRGLTDVVEAFRRIASSGAVYEANGSPDLAYLSRTIVDASGSATGTWYVDNGLREAAAVERASARGAYVLWGVTPFLQLAGQQPLQLVPLVTADPILRRIMVSIVVNPGKVRGVNSGGAQALQSYLLAPRTQARILASRHPQLGTPIFFPAGRDNDPGASPPTNIFERHSLGPDDHVICADEKTSIQARQRQVTAPGPGRPGRPGKPGHIESDYKRAGARQYLAAWDVRRGIPFGCIELKTGIEPFMRLVDQIMAIDLYRAANRVFLIVDNGSSHQGNLTEDSDDLWDDVAAALRTALDTRRSPDALAGALLAIVTHDREQALAKGFGWSVPSCRRYMEFLIAQGYEITDHERELLEADQ